MLSDDDLLEAARLRRRRLLAALCDGSQAPREGARPRVLVRLAVGLGVGAMLTLGTGVGGMVGASLHDQQGGGASPPPAATGAPTTAAPSPGR